MAGCGIVLCGCQDMTMLFSPRATQIALRSEDDPKEFSGLCMALRASFEDVPPASLDFAIA